MTNKSIEDRFKLSKREIEVVQEVVLGLTNKTIADRLFVSEKTVKFHLTNIYKKFGVTSRAQLMVKVMTFKNDQTVETENHPVAHV